MEGKNMRIIGKVYNLLERYIEAGGSVEVHIFSRDIFNVQFVCDVNDITLYLDHFEIAFGALEAQVIPKDFKMYYDNRKNEIKFFRGDIEIYLYFSCNEN